MKVFTEFCVNDDGVECKDPSCWDVVDTESGRQMVSFCKNDTVDEPAPKNAKKAKEVK